MIFVSLENSEFQAYRFISPTKVATELLAA